MKRIVRYGLIFLTSIALVSSIGYSTFLIVEIQNSDSKISNNVYQITFNYLNPDNNVDEISSVIPEVEEDSIFELPVLSYNQFFFHGWSFNSNRTSSINLTSTSIQDLKVRYPDTIKIDNYVLNLYAVVNHISENEVLLKITDNTETSSIYYMKTKRSKFSLFNIKYAYNDAFVELSIKELSINGETYNIDDVIDLSNYDGQELEIVVTKGN